MKRQGPGAELRQLKRFVAEIEAKFLAAHLVGSTLAAPTRAEVLDVAAYTVLVHGAFENFVEGVGIWLVGRVEEGWLLHQRVSRGTASLLLYSAAGATEQTERSVYDNVRVALREAKGAISRKVEGNNGITPVHLRAILRPLGVDITTDPTLIASLDMLVRMRHDWAHQYRFGARVTKTAADAKKISDDCMSVAERIAASAMRAKP